MDYKNVLLIAGVVAAAIAVYFVIEPKVIETDSISDQAVVSTGDSNDQFVELPTGEEDEPLEVSGSQDTGVLDQDPTDFQELPVVPEDEPIEDPISREEEATESATDTITAGLDYTDGSYTADTSYDLPNGKSHGMQVSLAIADDVVTAVSVIFDGQTNGGSTPIQSQFRSALPTFVLGQPIDDIAASRVGGASLTTGGFNNALVQIKAQAKI